jgi:hypothetical protein
MPKNETQNPYATPAAIVAAGLMIAAALFAGGQGTDAAPAAPAAPVRAAGAGCGA